MVPESEMNSQHEVESPLPLEQQQQHTTTNRNHPLSSLGRQSSIYSLTLDEFQHTLWESGKNFGSMNMDEFLSSIWSAEEYQVLNSNSNNLTLSESVTENEKGVIRKQPSLPRQGSLTLPAPLCRKTVDEVWSEIHNKGQHSQQHQHQHQQNSNSTNNNCGGVSNNNNNVQNTESAPRQPTFGEMTLEDFLIKAGVVREQCAMPQQQHMQQYGMYPNNNPTMGPCFVGRAPAMGMAGALGGSSGNVVAPPYQTVQQGGVIGGAIGESSGYGGNGKRDAGYPPLVPQGVCFGGRVVNGAGGYATMSNMGVVAPVSPVSPEGIGTGENCGGQFGMEMSMMRGRKRVLDGPVEKVVERRQRRMIKNRESAARSRARKQAYTVELEAELNQLKEENTQLKLALVDLERRRKQQCLEKVNGRVQTNAQKTKKKLVSLRKTLSCPLL